VALRQGDYIAIQLLRCAGYIGGNMADKIAFSDFDSTALSAAIELVKNYTKDFSELEGDAKVEAITNRVVDVFSSFRYANHLPESYTKDHPRNN
jgi:hypothetical protein